MLRRLGGVGIISRPGILDIRIILGIFALGIRIFHAVGKFPAVPIVRHVRKNIRPIDALAHVVVRSLRQAGRTHQVERLDAVILEARVFHTRLQTKRRGISQANVVQKVFHPLLGIGIGEIIACVFVVFVALRRILPDVRQVQDVFLRKIIPQARVEIVCLAAHRLVYIEVNIIDLGTHRVQVSFITFVAFPLVVEVVNQIQRHFGRREEKASACLAPVSRIILVGTAQLPLQSISIFFPQNHIDSGTRDVPRGRGIINHLDLLHAVGGQRPEVGLHLLHRHVRFHAVEQDSRPAHRAGN